MMDDDENGLYKTQSIQAGSLLPAVIIRQYAMHMYFESIK
jgi:hypothetical protein